MRLTRSACLAISAALLLSLPCWARTRPHYGGVLHVETRSSAADSDQLRALVAESLTLLDEQGRVHPFLADHWESQNADRRWVFSVHPRISMHDGTPLTGKVVAQILGAIQSGAPWRTVQGSDTTVTFDCDTSAPNLPAFLASADFAVVKRSGDGTLIGTGPFRISSFNTSFVAVDASDTYWQGRAYVDRVEIAGNRSVRSQWLDLNVGRADVVDVPGESLRRAQQDHLRTVESEHGEVVLLAISPDLVDINLRRAISASIDRSALANVIFQRQGQPASTLLPNNMTGYAVLFPPAFDLASARALRARFATIPVLNVSYDAADPTMQLAAERIALNARDAGIALQAVPQNGNGSAALRLMRVPVPSTDAAACLYELSRDLAGQSLPGDSDVSSVYQQERELLDQARLIPLVHLSTAVATSDRVRDFQNLRSNRNLADVWIEERR